MPQDFGALLRQRRIERGRTLADLAKHLGVSTTYLWDTEKGTRAPWDRDRVLKAAAFLETDPLELLVAAGVGRGEFALSAVHPCPQAQEVAALLVLRWEELVEAELEQIRRVLRVPLPRKSWEEVRERLAGLVGGDLDTLVSADFLAELRGEEPR